MRLIPRWLGSLWTRLRAPAVTWSLGALLLAGGMGGIVFWGGLNTAMEQTNTLEFCVSCHVMRDTVYEEYKLSVHYKNASGVRAICSDCHVPKDWTHKVVRKIKASGEVYHWLAGTIDTPEKFAAHRPVMAERVWKQMKETDSRECRNCHSFEAMDFHKQSQRASEKMQEAVSKGTETCIDCHKGIAHKLPPKDD
ncbi:MAG: NapC/NirT family cytochrome c [Rhizobiaceae bacterium]